jgi:tRNA-dihydrouridine synthase
MPPFRLYLAPLRGVTGHIFRTVYARYFSGFDLAIMPFITTVRSRTVSANHLRDILPEHNRGLPAIPQLIGNSAEDFVRMAGWVAGSGYTCVNWNLGCPFPQVTSKKRGSGLLPWPALIDAFLDRAMARMPVKLSVKVRLGLHDPAELAALMPIFNRYPIAEVQIHARTGTQMYEGAADIDAFERCAGLSAHPVVYNGDIFTRADFSRLSRRLTGVSRWMIGRGAIRDPFLAARIRGTPEVADPIGVFREFHDALFHAYLEARRQPVPVLGIMKELWGYWAQSFDGGGTVLRRIQRTKSPEEYRQEVGAHLREAVMGSCAHVPAARGLLFSAAGSS